MSISAFRSGTIHSTSRVGRACGGRCLPALAAIAGLLLIADWTTAAHAADPVSDYEIAPRLLAQLPYEPFAAAFSADGSHFATGHNDGSIVVWRTVDGRPLLRLSGHRDTVADLAFNVAGDRLASAAYDGTVRAWSTETGAAISVLEPQAGRLTSVTLSPDGTQVAAGGYDGIVRVWHDLNVAAGSNATSASAGTIRSLAFSPDGQQIAVGDDAGTLRLLNAADLSVLHSAAEHAGPLRCLAYAPDGQWLLSGGDDGNFIAWHAHTLERRWSGPAATPTPTPAHDNPLVGLAITTDARLIATADQSGEVRIWDVATRELTSQLAGHRDGISAVGFQPAAQAVVTIGGDRSVNLWKARLPPTPRLASIEGAPGSLWSLQVARDHSALFAAGRNGFLGAWDLESGKLTRQFAGFSGTIDAIDLSDDGQHLAVCGWREKTAVIFDARTGAKLGERTAEANLRCVRFSPDGLSLAAGRDDGRLHVWAWQNSDDARTAAVSEQAVYDLAYSPDGEQLVACGGDWRKPEPGFIKLLNTRDLAVVGELAEHAHAVRSVTFNAAGTRLASADEAGLVVVWNPETQLPVERLKNAAGARPLAWSPDGQRLAVGLHDGTIYIWEVAAADIVHRFRSADDVFALVFSGDGSVLFSASGKPRVEAWPVVEASSTIARVRGWIP